MAAQPPLSQRIMDAAEHVLRRHGAAKTNVVDVARMLGMSHANIYRHFPSKKALLDAVAARWLETVSGPLETIAADETRSASERLAAWFHALRLAKLRKVRKDPELFRVYHGIVENAHEVVGAHVDTLLSHVQSIIAAGIEGGEFSAGLDVPAAARAFLLATAHFHHPALVVQDPLPTEADADAVCKLLLAGLTREAKVEKTRR